TGLALSGTTPIATALGGIVTALGASLVFKVNTTRKHERSLSREYQFIYDLSVATLDRILPILIERLREAGLAPVFVVDELDKVDELSKRIISMVHHLKKLVAENAFFCFLTNRSYFEEMLAQGSGRAYPVEYTYYTHRLFVVFAPEDFERYLLKRLPNPQLPNIQTQAVQSAVQVAPETADLTACAILRWALRHRSQLHVVDLQREIAALRDDEGRVRTAPEDIVSARRNIIDITFQVAIESTLGQRDVIQVMQYRPEFRRLLHDAMYYVSRHWLAGAEEVDLSDAGRDDFLVYLESRTGRDEERRPNANDHDSADTRPSVTENDLDFLFDQVRILADFLSNRPSVETVAGDATGATRDWRNERLAAWGDSRRKRGLPDLEPDVLDALLVGDRSSLLVRDVEHPLVYQFRHRVAGTTAAAQPGAVAPPKRTAPARPPRAAVKTPPSKVEVEPPAAPPAEEKGQAPAAAPPLAVQATAWEGKARFIEQFANALHAVTLTEATATKQGSTRRPGTVSAVTLDTLATRFRVITSSPTASVVLQAIANLRDASSRGSAHAGYADDVFAVDQFHQILERNGEQIARAIVLGAAVGRTCPETTPDARIAAGLAVIARAMQFANKREEEVGTSLENVSAMVRTEYGASFEEPLNRLAREWPDIDAFSKRTREALDVLSGFPSPLPDADVDRAWESMQDRLNHWVQNNEVLDPDVSELLAAAARRGPTELLEFDPREMTLAQWTRTLLLARRKVLYPAAPEGTDLSWLTFYAWHALGFRSLGDINIQKLAEWAGIGVEFSTGGASGHWPFQLQRAYKAIQDGHLFNTGETPISTLIMIRRTKSPMTAAWRPVPDAAVLLVTADELSEFRQGSPGPRLELPITNERLCAIEMEPELATHLYNLQLPAIKLLFQGGWLIYVYPADRGREMKMPNVVAPPDAQVVIEAGIQGRTLIPDAPAV
ncbi:MAG TPA: hypothetical protein VK864_07300, partial [Longimicrobiales bacterium]|nr:hypothetical protein [Longimicrobiales bacterium]